MWADDRSPWRGGSPAVEEGADTLAQGPQIRELLVKFVRFAGHEIADVHAGRAPGALDRDDLLDLLQREAEALRLADKREQGQRLYAVDAIARGSASRWRENPVTLIEPQ